MDTIALVIHLKNVYNRRRVINFLDKNLVLQYNSKNPNNIVDFANYKLYKLKNIRVMLFVDKIKIQGSIVKYYSDSNVDQLTDEELVKAFEKLQSDLPIFDLYFSRISRLDYGVSFPISFNPKVVISKFIDKNNSTKSTYKSTSTTVDIGNRSHELSIYDKGTESNIFNKSNIIRIEYRMLKPKTVNQNFNVRHLTLEDLLTKLDVLPELWYKNYQQIVKDYSPCFSNIKSKSDLTHRVYYEYGYENCLQLINSSAEEEAISKSQRTTLKRFLRDLANNGKEIADPNSPVIEIDKLVDNHLENCRLYYKNFKQN